MRILFVILVMSIGLSYSSDAQRVIKPKLIEVDWKGIIYKKEWSIDFRMHENGAAIAYNMATIKSYHKTNFYQLELGFTKDPRERNQSKISQIGRSGSFAFGKINSLINLRGSIGSKKYLSEKEKRRGVAVGYTYMFGPSIALLKPYYLDLIYTEVVDDKQVATIRSERFSEENADVFLDDLSINDRSSFFKGFDEIAIRGGIHGKVGLHLAMGAFDKYVKAFETGIMFDVFPTKIPILRETEEVSNQRIFIKLFMSLQLGKRSN